VYTVAPLSYFNKISVGAAAPPVSLKKSARNIAPNLYTKAIRKNKKVQEALNSNRWVRHVTRAAYHVGQ